MRIGRGCVSRRSQPRSRPTTASGSCARCSAPSRRPRRSGPRPARRADVIELCEDWMRPVDQVMADPQLLETVYEALARRWTHSRTRGRKGTPAEVVLRLLLLKHVRNWSYAVLEREVRANLVYRQFTRVGAAKVPDAKTLGKLGIALGPEVIEQIHQRVVAIAQGQKIVQGAPDARRYHGGGNRHPLPNRL